jgi:hypothetical protein
MLICCNNTALPQPLVLTIKQAALTLSATERRVRELEHLLRKRLSLGPREVLESAGLLWSTAFYVQDPRPLLETPKLWRPYQAQQTLKRYSSAKSTKTHLTMNL